MGTPLNSARFSGPGNYITQTITGTVATVLPADASRKYLRIQANYNGTQYGPLAITFDGSVPSATNGLLLWNTTATGIEYGNDISAIEFGTSFVPTGAIRILNLSPGNPASVFVIWA